MNRSAHPHSGPPRPPELRRYARETEPRDLEVARLRRRLRESLRAEEPPEWIDHGLFGRLFAPLVGPAGWLERDVFGRLLAPSSGGTRLISPGSMSLVAVAVALLLAVMGPRSRPLEPLEMTSPRGAQLSVSTDVKLDFAGQGRIAGTESAPRIAWRSGRVRAQVTPDQGIDLRVETPDAEVRVVGTIFSVDRDALGTRVEVEKGKVEVRCVDGSVRFVVPGEVAWCEPGTAAGLLARARKLQADGAALASILTSVDAGLELQASSAVQTELRWVRAESLRSHGRTAAAVRTAAAALDAGAGHRQEDFAALVSSGE